LTTTKKIFFASDFHLGIPSNEVSLEREKKIIDWLNHCAPQAEAIYLVGDVFDFWFEYQRCVPKGFVRFLGTLANITDQGIPVYLFPGNHDLWVSDYLVKECGVIIVKNALEFKHLGKHFYVHHGDGLGPGDFSYKFLKKIFTARSARFLFQWIHPNLGIALAQKLSKKSRLSQNPKEDNYLGNDHEHLAQFVSQHLAKTSPSEKPDYFIFGHRHLVVDVQIDTARYINLGEWLHGSQYAVFDGESLQLLHWPSQQPAKTNN
jgi:UDP-2,3-diacylglucosamine hydrolase